MVMRILPLILLIITGCTPDLQPQAFLSPITKPSVIYLPSVGDVGSKLGCYRTTQAAAFARLLIDDSRQQRVGIRCHPALVEAAQRRAESMATQDYFGHCDLTGVCANRVAIESGCRLPTYYPANGNNIESIGAGTGNTALMWALLSASPSHAIHLLGLHPFYREQLDLGVAFVEVPGSRYRYYWVALVAICGE